MYKRINQLVLIGSFILISTAHTQTLNSPYSRYGLGDPNPTSNALNRSMGGVAAAYADFQSVNFFNPASYGQLQSVTYDFGVELDNISILSKDPTRRFSSLSPVISYINLGIPLKKGGGWAWVFGLRPVTRIRYKIIKTEELPLTTGAETVSTLYEGNGGTQQFYTGTGFRFGKFNVGVNLGYIFGSKDYSTRRVFLNDTTLFAKSNHQTSANFNGFVLNTGVQYALKLNSKLNLRLGAQGNLQQNLSGTRDIVRETFNYDQNGATFPIDSVYMVKEERGKVRLPASYTLGFILERAGQWQFGADYTTTRWNEYRFFNEQDQVVDNWQLRMGAQLIPEVGKNYWSNVAYRAGMSVGKDYISAGGNLTRWSLSFGAGLPMRRVTYTNQFSIINIAFEYGQRGNSGSIVKENFFNLALGLSMSDIWFIKRKYD